jgi:hypothetical protein
MRKWIGMGAGVALAALLVAPGGWSQNGNNAGNGAQQPAPRNIEMVPAKAELQKGLNAKKLRPGQTVTAKLVQTVNLPNEPALKKNTVLVGKVDAVEPSQHHSNSQITVTFNQARLKDGTVLPVKVTVMQLASPPEAATGMGTAGGAAAVEPTSQPTAGNGSGAGTPMPTGVGPAKEDEPSEPMSVPTPAPTSVSRNGIPGVMLKSDIHQSTSATFLSKGRNVEVPGGTQMQVAIAYIPQGAQVQ